MPFVGNTYQLAKLTADKNGQYLALEELRKRYNSDVIGLKLGNEHVIVVFGNALLNDTFHRDEFQGRPDNFFMRLRTMGKRLGKYEIYLLLLIFDSDTHTLRVHISTCVRLQCFENVEKYLNI